MKEVWVNAVSGFTSVILQELREGKVLPAAVETAVRQFDGSEIGQQVLQAHFGLVLQCAAEATGMTPEELIVKWFGDQTSDVTQATRVV